MDWTGKTAVIVGAGEIGQKARKSIEDGAVIVAVNRAVASIPDADLLVSIDNNPDADFGGPRITGFDCGGYECARMASGEVLHIRNNYLAAMRLAVKFGAARLVLLGLDIPKYEALHDFRGLSEAFESLCDELRAVGVEIVRP